MSETDHALLVRAAQVSRAFGIVVAEARARQAHGRPLPAAPLREIGQVLRALGDDMIARAQVLDDLTRAVCALCSREPVARPDQLHATVEGRFCGGCLARCLDDTDQRRWCPIDAHARDLDHREDAPC